ncbi:hypothetical protein THRCLA_01632 [Thraustotheca clavata]|uniref:Protein kinase domain-containing protein n=1 Tax=Thraustotheca clavata TaxID=74557 RepID=A0A1W0A7W8_9STRA|nr:hypothetical protein THRCLA_01632 [Thraustotheca clavata]
MPTTNVDCTYKVCPQHFAKGRLGHLHMAIECTSGSIVAVEEIQLILDASANFTTLYSTMDYEFQQLSALKHQNLLHYIGLTHCDHTIHVVSEHTAGGTLAKTLQEYGKLHRAIVSQYINRVLHGLQALHEQGYIHGRISSSNIFISPLTQIKIASYFPSLETTHYIMQHHPVAGKLMTPALQSFSDGICRDLRSMVWIMAEMLLGTQMRGIHLDDQRILEMVRPFSLEYEFLSTCISVINQIMQSESHTDYSELFAHHYFSPEAIAQLIEAPTAQIHENNSEKDELEGCIKLRNELMKDIETWLSEFQVQTGRHPKKKEWPANIMEKQVRTTTLRTRIQNLHELIQRKASQSMVIFGQPCQKIESDPIATPQTTSCDRKRSTAQEAFLAQISLSAQTILPIDKEVDDDEFDDDEGEETGTSRAAKQRLMHQRRQEAHL